LDAVDENFALLDAESLERPVICRAAACRRGPEHCGGRERRRGVRKTRRTHRSPLPERIVPTMPSACPRGWGGARYTRGSLLAARRAAGATVSRKRREVFVMKKIGFLSFGHWSESPHSQVRSASDALLQSIELAVAAEELGTDG